MYNVTYEGLPLRPTRSAIVEMTHKNIDLYDVKEVLEEGYDCPRSRRSKEKIEKCLKRKKPIKVVVAKSYERWSNEEVWAVIHVGVAIR